MNKPSLAGLILLVLLSITGKSAYAQDVAFSQPYANPSYLNPAFAGTGNSQRFGLNYRNEWPNVPGNFVIYNASYDRNFIDTNNGIGILTNMSTSGSTEITTENFSLIYAHQFHIKSFTLSAGVQGTYLQSIDESKPVFNNYPPFTMGFTYTTEPVLLRTNLSVPDFSAGILGYGKNYFAGFSLDHLTQPNVSFVQDISPLALKYTANAGVMIPWGSVVISPTLLYIEQQDLQQLEMEWSVSAKHFVGGLGYRLIDAFGNGEDMANYVSNTLIFSTGYKGKLLRVGYSYDFTISKLAIATGGIHEVSLAVLLPYKSPKFKKANGINCPAF